MRVSVYNLEFGVGGGLLRYLGMAEDFRHTHFYSFPVVNPHCASLDP